MRFTVVLVVVCLLACERSRSDLPAAASEAVDAPRYQDAALSAAIEGNSTLRLASAAIADGHPWRATVALTPVLADKKTSSPAALLLAARAAAGWGGWNEVERILSKESWVDSSFGGEGAELLARAALERGDDAAAREHASNAVRAAPDARSRAERQTYLARSLDRGNQVENASSEYAAAAGALSPAADWLLLRSAGSERDPSERERIYKKVRDPVARARVPWTEAQARERFGDYAGAASRFAALGATVQALRLRLTTATDSANRARIKEELLSLIRAKNGSADARGAVDVLDWGFKTLSPSEELIVARSAAMSGPPQRARIAFERAMTTPAIVTPADRIQYALVLSRLGRTSDALASLAAVQGPLAGQAAYQRARIQLGSGAGTAARATLRDVVARFASDTATAPPALYLLADLATDDRDTDQARNLFRTLYRTYPASALADDARFQAAIIDFAAGNYSAAAAAFDSLVTLYPRSPEAISSRYWAGRAWSAAGNKALAADRWRSVMSQQPVSYYALLSARRLNSTPWVPAANSDSVPHVAAVDDALSRVLLLQRLGMDTEARFELDAMERQAGTSPDLLLATAYAFLNVEQPSRAIRLGSRLVGQGQRDARAYRLVYPVVDPDEISTAARNRSLDPSLVAAVIRQESEFNPRAVSAAGARGLMQLLPPVGEEIARGLRFPVWQPSLLFDPDANLLLGTAHLAGYARQYGALPRMLAAYNAGGARVARWSGKIGADDPELFVEQIPFAETRDYVRIVQRNAVMYRALYPWPLTSPARAGSPTPSSSAAAGRGARRTLP